jgi:hypothetical protein
MRTPQQTTYAIAVSSALVAASFLALDIRITMMAEDQTLPFAWKLLLLVSFIGLASRVLFLRGLRAGVQANIWPEDQLSLARQTAESTAWNAAVWIFLFAVLVLYTLPHRGHHSAAVGIFGILIVLSPLEAISILRPAIPPSRPYGANSIYPVKPLQSSHWGTPRNS